MKNNPLIIFLKLLIIKKTYTYNYTDNIIFCLLNSFFLLNLNLNKFIHYKKLINRKIPILIKPKYFSYKKRKLKRGAVWFSKKIKKIKLLFVNIKKIKKIKSIDLKKNKKQTNINIYKNFIVKDKFNYFFSNFFYKLFKKQVLFINYNYFLKTKVSKFKNLVRILFYKNKFFKKTNYMYKILKLSLTSLIYKDSKILVYIIKEMFELVHYSKHRIYFIFWKNFILSFLAKYYKKLNILGIKLEFHGKLGVGGNSKKRSYYYSAGRCSNSTKKIKIDSTNSFFRTETGVVGFTYSIYY